MNRNQVLVYYLKEIQIMIVKRKENKVDITIFLLFFFIIYILFYSLNYNLITLLLKRCNLVSWSLKVIRKLLVFLKGSVLSMAN